MSKKDLNPAGVINELKGQSVFFEARPVPAPSPIQPTPTKPKQAKDTHARTPERPNARTGEQVDMRTGGRPNGRTGERPIKRHSFNFFADQIEALIRLEQASGQRGAMSGWVRQALDDFLEKHPDTEGERPNG